MEGRRPHPTRSKLNEDMASQCGWTIARSATCAVDARPRGCANPADDGPSAGPQTPPSARIATTNEANALDLAGADDFQVAMATYHAARKRFPKAAMTLRQGTWVIEDSRRTRIGTLFSFPWSEKDWEGGGR